MKDDIILKNIRVEQGMIDYMQAYCKADIPDLQQVVPFFQPIVSLQTQRIIAYESLGREIVDGRVRSLGPFFNDAHITEEVHIKVDRRLRELAFEKMMKTDQDFQALFKRIRAPSVMDFICLWICHSNFPYIIKSKLKMETVSGR